MFPKKNNQIKVADKAKRPLSDINFLEWLAFQWKFIMGMNVHTRNHIFMFFTAASLVVGLGLFAVIGYFSPSPSATESKEVRNIKSGLDREKEIEKIIGTDIAERKILKKARKLKPIAPKFGKLSGNATKAEYIKHFAPLAIKEMIRTGVPASITLAQGLIESRNGNSSLCKASNNHFGIKCQDRRCKRRGHCVNYADDVPWDRFVVYSSAEHSYRAHSDFLKGDKKHRRYQRLFKLGKKDYRRWALGLKQCGYATNPRYAQILIGTIEGLGLHKYDQ